MMARTRNAFRPTVAVVIVEGRGLCVGGKLLMAPVVCLGGLPNMQSANQHGHYHQNVQGAKHGTQLVDRYP